MIMIMVMIMIMIMIMIRMITMMIRMMMIRQVRAGDQGVLFACFKLAKLIQVCMIAQ